MHSVKRYLDKKKQEMGVRFRQSRFETLKSLLDSLDGHVCILDVGGTSRFWSSVGFVPTGRTSITLLNRRVVELADRRFGCVVGDARRLPFVDAAFDVVFSNSVIEHVGDYGNQRQMAQEIRRVGKRYFVETPNRRFPIEPHVAIPAFQFLPPPLRIWLLTTIRTRRSGRSRKPEQIRASVQRRISSIHMLSKRELKDLFPEATLHTERFCGLAKSFTVYSGWTE